MHCYLLTLGQNIAGLSRDGEIREKTDAFKKSENQPKIPRYFLCSDCYYTDIAVFDLSRKFKGTVFEAMKTILPEIRQISVGYAETDIHVLQDMLLMSDADNDLLSGIVANGTAPLLYFSFLNLSCGIPADKLKQSAQLPHGICELYYSMDFGEYILVTNASEITMEKYLDLLDRLYQMPEVADITSIYAYNPVTVQNFAGKADAVISEEASDSPTVHADFSVNTLGRYDTTHLLTDRRFAELFSGKGKKVHIGKAVSAGSVRKADDKKRDGRLADARESFNAVYLRYRKEIQALAKDVGIDHILHPIAEIHKMIVSMLTRGISQYFVICILESFCGLLQYLRDDLIPSGDPQRWEEANDLINDYSRHISCLAGSMLHNERKFIQADPFQLVYFDLPPKLIAFYTAIARQMVDILSGSDSENRYTFLFVPDFKIETSVSMLTQNFDTEDEQHLLAIHISENAVYDISGTVLTIAHEIAHHVGQSAADRKQRAEHYIKCAVAVILLELFAEKDENGLTLFPLMSVFGNTLDEQKESIYATVDRIAEEWKKTEQYRRLIEGETEIGKPLYYSDDFAAYVVGCLCDYVSDGSSDHPVRNFFLNGIEICNSAVPGKVLEMTDFDFSELGNGNRDAAFSKALARNLLDQILREKLEELSEEITSNEVDPTGKITYPVFETVSYLFRESMADVQMILLLSDPENRDPDNSVFSAIMNDYSGRDWVNEDDKVRCDLVQRAFDRNRDSSIDNILPLYRYITDQCLEYIRYIADSSPAKGAGALREQIRKLYRAQSGEALFDVMNAVISSYTEALPAIIFGKESEGNKGNS